MGRNNGSGRLAYNYVHLLEDIGMQFMLSGSNFNQSLSETIKLISPYSLILALSLLMRSSDEKIIDDVITKEYIQNWAVEAADEGYNPLY